MWRKPGRTLMHLFAMAVAAFFLCLSLVGYFGIRAPFVRELGRTFPEKRLIVKPKTLEIGPVKMNRTKLNAIIIDRIGEISGVDAIYPIQPICFPVRAEGSIFGQEIMTDIVVNGVPPHLVEDAVAPGEVFEGKNYSPDRPAPVVISRYFLDLYNMGIARSNNLPQFNEETAIGRTFDLVLGESTISGLVHTEKARRISCRVVGFTPDASLLGLVMPLEIVKVLNAWYHGHVVLDYTLAQVEIRDVKDVEDVIGALEGLGLAVESNREILGRFRFILNVISGVALLFTGVVLFLAALNLAHSESLAVIEQRSEIGLLHALGLGRMGLLRLILGEKMVLGFIAGILGAGTLVLLWYGIGSRMEAVASDIPFIKNVITREMLPSWIPVAGVLFSTFWGAFFSSLIIRGVLFTPPGRLMNR